MDRLSWGELTGQVINNMQFEDAKSGWKRYGCTEVELKGRRGRGHLLRFL
jgi:hypothetical protein